MKKSINSTAFSYTLVLFHFKVSVLSRVSWLRIALARLRSRLSYIAVWIIINCIIFFFSFASSFNVFASWRWWRQRLCEKSQIKFRYAAALRLFLAIAFPQVPSPTSTSAFSEPRYVVGWVQVTFFFCFCIMIPKQGFVSGCFSAFGLA